MESKQPMLQVAMDTKDLDSALKVTRLVYDVVDIIEVGTILCLAEGLGAVKTIKTLYPNNLVLADVRVAEAGALISKMVFEAGANWISVLSSASIPTIETVKNEAFSKGGDVQIELQEGWTIEKLNQCKAMGITQVIFHKSRDAEKSNKGWNDDLLNTIRTMSDQGFRVSITGNLNPADLSTFKGIPVYSFVAGRAIREAADPRAAAEEFKTAIRETWK